jgi:hypothetical protein
VSGGDKEEDEDRIEDDEAGVWGRSAVREVLYSW